VGRRRFRWRGSRAGRSYMRIALITRRDRCEYEHVRPAASARLEPAQIDHTRPSAVAERYQVAARGRVSSPTSVVPCHLRMHTAGIGSPGAYCSQSCGDGGPTILQRLSYGFTVPAMSHSRTVVSSPAVASSRPSGLNATDVTPLVCPVMGSPTWRRVVTSHNRTVASEPVVASSRSPSSPPRRALRRPGPGTRHQRTPICPRTRRMWRHRPSRYPGGESATEMLNAAVAASRVSHSPATQPRSAGT